MTLENVLVVDSLDYFRSSGCAWYELPPQNHHDIIFETQSHEIELLLHFDSSFLHHSDESRWYHTGASRIEDRVEIITVRLRLE